MLLYIYIYTHTHTHIYMCEYIRVMIFYFLLISSMVGFYGKINLQKKKKLFSKILFTVTGFLNLKESEKVSYTKKCSFPYQLFWYSPKVCQI